MKGNTPVARVKVTDAGLERIKRLVEEQLARAAVNSRQHRALSAAIRIETDVYRKSLDTEQARATHDREIPARSPARISEPPIHRSKTESVPRRKIHTRSRSAPRR